jgi:hypothetical protein
MPTNKRLPPLRHRLLCAGILAPLLALPSAGTGGSAKSPESGQGPYEYGNFLSRKYQSQTLVKVDRGALDNYIPVDIYLSKLLPLYNGISEDTQGMAHGLILCTLFQLGYSGFTSDSVDLLEKRLLTDTDGVSVNSVTLQLLAFLGGRIDKGLLSRGLTRLETALSEADAENKFEIITVKKILYKYLYLLSFFRQPGNRQLIGEVLERLYPERKIRVEDELSGELFLDLSIAQALYPYPRHLLYDGAGFPAPAASEERLLPGGALRRGGPLHLDVDLKRLRAALKASWRENSYFYLSDCRNQCDLKSIGFVIRADIWYGCVPKEQLQGMLRYLAASFRKDTEAMSLDSERIFLFTNACDDFCGVNFWQKLYFLNYLSARLGQTTPLRPMTSVISPYYPGPGIK